MIAYGKLLSPSTFFVRQNHRPTKRLEISPSQHCPSRRLLNAAAIFVGRQRIRHRELGFPRSLLARCAIREKPDIASDVGGAAGASHTRIVAAIRARRPREDSEASFFFLGFPRSFGRRDPSNVRKRAHSRAVTAVRTLSNRIIGVNQQYLANSTRQRCNNAESVTNFVRRLYISFFTASLLPFASK